MRRWIRSVKPSESVRTTNLARRARARISRPRIARGKRAAAGAVRLFRQALGGQTLAGPTLAALAGVLTVGMVDSVVDMPRVTVFLMFLLWLALTLRQPPGQRPAR